MKFVCIDCGEVFQEIPQKTEGPPVHGICGKCRAEDRKKNYELSELAFVDDEADEPDAAE